MRNSGLVSWYGFVSSPTSFYIEPVRCRHIVGEWGEKRVLQIRTVQCASQCPRQNSLAGSPYMGTAGQG